MDEHRVVAEIHRLTLRELRLWMREGWFQPAQGEAGPVFDDVDVARIRLVCDLRKDMELPSDTNPVPQRAIKAPHAWLRTPHFPDFPSIRP